MFDKSDFPLLFCGLMFAGVLSLAGQSGAPVFNEPIAVDVSALPEIPIAEEFGAAPHQTDVVRQTVRLAEGFQADLLFAYAMDGVVVTRRIFRSDATSAISPLDLGIVWGDLAQPGMADGIRFRAGRRMVSFRTDDITNLPSNWEEQVTNNHLIPASDAVRTALMEVEVGQRVQITGFLVRVTGDDIHPWRSSIRRDDSSLIGGCEIILVRSVTVIGEAV